ncbi:MAG: AAA family ATPase [Candidatus Electrothrix communis]|nr:MAG: AAA family ATPase [Candidatus Electrothrix communis]
MYLQHFGLEHSPFSRQPNPDVFFAQAGRKNILKDLRQDLLQGNAAMLLTGPKASGKTVFCRLIRHRLDGSSRKVVYLENPVGSFDGLLKQVCLKLGMTVSMGTEQDMVLNLHALLRSQKEKGRKVLLLIDESEKMFLATLERLFRLLNELNEQYGAQAMLVGQPALNSSFEQLSGYCEGVRIASSYKLEAFSLEETGAYLVYRLKTAGDRRGTSDPVFSEEAVQEVFRLGQGIPGIMDGIAEAALENAATVGASSVLPVHVAPLNDPVAVSVAMDEEEPGGRRKWLLLLLLLAVIALFFLERPSFFLNRKEVSQEAVQESISIDPENTEIQLALPEEDQGAPLPFAPEETITEVISSPSSTEQNEEVKPSLLSLPIPQRLKFKKKEDVIVASVTQEEKSDTESISSLDDKELPLEVSTSIATAEEDKPQAPQEMKTPEVVEYGEQFEKTDKEVVAEVVAEAVEEGSGETMSVLSPGEVGTETLATAKKLPVIKPTWIIELTPGMKKKRPLAAEEHAAEKPALESEQERKEATIAPPKPKTLVSVASARGVAASAVSGPQRTQAQIQTFVAPPVQGTEAIQVPKIEIRPVAPLSRSAKADQLFARYLGAGNRWTKEAYGDKFTVQLVVLSSDDAADDIKNMIFREEYQEHKGKFYILRRDTLPPTLFVCYGVYSSMDEARNARNTMPLFLRKHHPYALSISDVLAKARD